ncbi:MAG: hypothetical protein IV107_18920 [Paucibacter sp.]|nr:hypothetical protein [Roseateles sp.]
MTKQTSQSAVQRICIAVFAFACSGYAWASEWTIAQPIEQINYDGEADYLYIVGAAGWGAPACPNAKYAYVKGSVAGHKQLLALALAAKSTGAKVNMRGECDGSDYFAATYIVLK